MCTELHHNCKVCNEEYICNDPDWVCSTLNFDENANVCSDCEESYWKDLLEFNKQEAKEND